MTLALEFSGLFGPRFGRLTLGVNERYLAIEAKGLKERNEAGSPRAG